MQTRQAPQKPKKSKPDIVIIVIVVVILAAIAYFLLLQVRKQEHASSGQVQKISSDQIKETMGEYRTVQIELTQPRIQNPDGSYQDIQTESGETVDIYFPNRIPGVGSPSN